MDTLEDLSLYFYIACGIGLGLHLLTFCLLCVFYCKIKRLAKTDVVMASAATVAVALGSFLSERSNQLNRQTSMMAEFCYTNPTIVPGEELSRRGFSMYCGNDTFVDDLGTKNKDINYGTYHEALSKF